MHACERQFDSGIETTTMWPGRRADVFGPGRCAMARTRRSLQGHFGGEPLIGRRTKTRFGDRRGSSAVKKRRFDSQLPGRRLDPARPTAEAEQTVPYGSNGQSLAELAQRIFASSPYTSIRRLTCIFHEGELVIAGAVGSFYLKQLAQIAVQKLDGVVRISNIVEVSK
jgi:hypothetical protein